MSRGFFKKLSQELNVAFDQNAASVTHHRLVTISSATQAITFAELDMPDMPDANYAVMVQIEGAATAACDESTKTKTGFSLVNAGTSGVANLVIGWAGSR